MKNLSCCGTDCSVCGCYGSLCKGCNTCEGKVFHAPQGSACPIYECAVKQKGFKNCGQCKEVPCSIWRNTRDPQYTDAQFEESIQSRVKALQEKMQAHGEW